VVPLAFLRLSRFPPPDRLASLPSQQSGSGKPLSALMSEEEFSLYTLLQMLAFFPNAGFTKIPENEEPQVGLRSRGLQLHLRSSARG